MQIRRRLFRAYTNWRFSVRYKNRMSKSYITRIMDEQITLSEYNKNNIFSLILEYTALVHSLTFNAATTYFSTFFFCFLKCSNIEHLNSRLLRQHLTFNSQMWKSDISFVITYVINSWKFLVKSTYWIYLFIFIYKNNNFKEFSRFYAQNMHFENQTITRTTTDNPEDI